MSRPVERDKPFQAALLVAFLFHLSALTLFSIVVRFQKAEIPYSTLWLVDSRRLQVATAKPTNPVSETPMVDTNPALDVTPRISVPVLLMSTNTKITIPSLTSSLQRYDEQTLGGAEGEMPRVSSNDFGWRFTMSALQGVGKDIRQGLEHLALISYNDDKKGETGPTDSEPGKLALGPVMEGCEASIEWISPPYNRKPLFTPRIQFLPASAATASTLSEPLAVLIQVNRDGNVTLAIPRRIEDPSGVMQAVVDSLRRYQFEPLTSETGQREQSATFVLEPNRPKE